MSKTEKIPSNVKSADHQFLFNSINEKLIDNINIKSTKDGFLIYFKLLECKHTYVLEKQRKGFRFFKSPSTLFKYLSDLGAEKFCVENISNWSNDTYVRKNKHISDKRRENNL